MFVSMNRLQCAAEYGDHLEHAFKHAGSLEGVSGFLLFQFLKEVKEDGSLLYVALTQWENRAAYEAWLKSESFQRAHQGPGGSPVISSTETFDVLN